MMTGVKARQLRRHLNLIEDKTPMGQFAELLAEGLETQEAARFLLRSDSWGYATLAKIRHMLGAQAV